MGNSPKGEYMLKRKNFIKLLGMGSLCLFLLGCSEESFLVQKESSTVILDEEVVLSQKENEELNILQKNENSQGMSALEETVGKGVLENTQTQSSDNAALSENPTIVTEIAVHICGAVNQPGVYYLKNNQRLYEGIQKAGGFREDADQDYLNQALVLEDGMKIIVPTKEEAGLIEESGKSKSETEVIQVGNDTEVTANRDIFIQEEDTSEALAVKEGYLQKKNFTNDKETEEQNGKVDLNTADEALLCTLPGIGESRARSIIAYREEHGLFQKPEDVMNVSGIKEAAFEKIKDYVTVSR